MRVENRKFPESSGGIEEEGQERIVEKEMGGKGRSGRREKKMRGEEI